MSTAVRFSKTFASLSPPHLWIYSQGNRARWTLQVTHEFNPRLTALKSQMTRCIAIGREEEQQPHGRATNDVGSK